MTEATQNPTPNATPAQNAGTLPEPLAQAEIDRRMGLLVQEFRGTGGCTDRAIALAESIADHRAGGRYVNVLQALPQMRVNFPDGHPGLDSRLDIDQPQNGLQVHETTAALLAAATVAARHHIAVSDVQINDEFLNLERQRCADVLKGSSGVCHAPSR